MQTMSDMAVPTIHWPAFAAANLDLFSITVFAILTIIVGTVLLLLSELLGPRRRDPEKKQSTNVGSHCSTVRGNPSQSNFTWSPSCSSFLTSRRSSCFLMQWSIKSWESSVSRKWVFSS